MMESLDEVLLEQTLITADKLRASPAATRREEGVEEREIVSDDGTILGVARLDRNSGSLIFTPTKDVFIDARERPISSFLARKIEEYKGKFEADKQPDGRLKALKIIVSSPDDLEKVFRLLKWAVIKSLVQ